MHLHDDFSLVSFLTNSKLAEKIPFHLEKNDVND